MIAANSIAAMNHPTVAFTGHRKYQNVAWTHSALAAFIGAAVQHEIFGFISGMAQGIDQVAAKMVLAQRVTDPRVKFVAARPFLEHGAGVPEYQSLVMAADLAVATSPRYTGRDTYVRRDHWMVDNADMVVAVLDNRTVGGTWLTTNYARGFSRPLYRINPTTKVAGWVGESGFEALGDTWTLVGTGGLF